MFLWRGSLVLLVLCLQGIQCDLVLETVTLAPSGGDFTLAPSGGDLDTCSTRLENGIVNLWPIGNSSDPPRFVRTCYTPYAYRPIHGLNDITVFAFFRE